MLQELTKSGTGSTLTSTFKLQSKDDDWNWVDTGQPFTRSAKQSQTVKGRKSGAVVWTDSEAVADTLKDTAGQSSNIDDSAATGGLGIDRGNVRAKTVWAGTSGNYSASVTVGYSPVSLKIEMSGTSVASAMEWGEPGLEWGFAVMTRQELEEWQRREFP